MSGDVPERGDLIWLTFSPQSGHEQAGRRPALVLSALAYNRRVGLALVCPITSKAKGYPFEVSIPPGLPVSGVILCDQIKSLDWRERQAEIVGCVPTSIMDAVIGRIEALLRG